MEMWINQTVTTGLVKIFCSLFKEEKEGNITTKRVVSVCFILLFLSSCQIYQNQPFLSLSLSIYIYIYIYKDGCCRSKERIRIYFKIGRSMKRFVFFESIPLKRPSATYVL